MKTITQEIVIVVENCIDCGTPFGIVKELRNSLIESHKIFYCPNGHGQCYRESDKDKEIKQLKRELKWKEEDRIFWEAEAERKARSLSATKGVLTKTKKRIANGVCPCCHRQFVNLHRHMESQHPNYSERSE